MKEFLLSGFILSCIFNAMWVLIIIGSEMKIITKVWFSMLLIIACTFIFSFMFSVEQKEWNNGICTNCGDSYVAYSYSHGATRYECRSCHKQVSK